MDTISWKLLCKRFPHTPAQFRMERPVERTPHKRPVLALAFSSDSRCVAAAGGGMIPGPAEVRAYDTATGRPTHVGHAHVMGVFQLAFDPRTGLLASASHDYSVILWNLAADDAIFLLGGPDDGVSRQGVAFLGTKLVVADGMTFQGEQATLSTIDLETGATRPLVKLDDDLGCAKLDVVRDAGLIVIAIEDMRSPQVPEIRVMTLDGAERARFSLGFAMYDLAAIDASTVVATGSSDDGQTIVWTTDLTGARLASRTLGKAIGAAVCVAPSRDRVAVGYDHSVELCAAATLAPERRIELGEAKVCSVAWSPDGETVAVGTRDRVVLFDAHSGRER